MCIRDRREVIEASSIQDKDEILRIIDEVANPDARDAHLKRLSRGETYRIMLRDYYPQIRRTEYTVAYEVKAFDVAEAREIIKVNPRLLSLNEMYLVAKSYPADSPEFKQVFDIATRMYPCLLYTSWSSPVCRRKPTRRSSIRLTPP